ncbi:unnamed protein product [Sphacelaria rigidula]
MTVSSPEGTAAAATAEEEEEEEEDWTQNQRNRWLEVPHPRMHERPFVLRPLADIDPDLMHPILACSVTDLLERVLVAGGVGRGHGHGHGDNSATRMGEVSAGERVLPMGIVRVPLLPLEGPRSKTYVMGILNATPDSFSDGGKHSATVEAAVRHALLMVSEGADIIDVGGEPGASEVSAEEEISRVVPVIEGIIESTTQARLGKGSSSNINNKNNNTRKGNGSTIAISVDTRRASVARAAVQAGAHVVNDVSGGTFDPEMLDVVAELGVPLIMMHMR